MTVPPGTRVLARARLPDVDPEFLADVRRWLKSPLHGCTPGAVREAAVVLGELLGNAFRHARPPFTVEVSLPSPGTAVRMAVHDATPSPAAGWPLGRGLTIVRRLCPDWGVERDADGKAVWAELPVLVAPV
ncbi:ATP-binding protein [Actinophytocola gossypii]|uniref:ATP-binding protein n=1 Tax=Actinophytocola gossypii TaxID=2812003 RepID=A0ABT2J9F7_9PSEU|nr:ATP-binding protein [Actinophytocola gossypii]MCT2584416.1 ATP-binding protein [Actinophytocola gossypii]